MIIARLPPLMVIFKSFWLWLLFAQWPAHLLKCLDEFSLRRSMWETRAKGKLSCFHGISSLYFSWVPETLKANSQNDLVSLRTPRLRHWGAWWERSDLCCSVWAEGPAVNIFQEADGGQKLGDFLWVFVPAVGWLFGSWSSWNQAVRPQNSNLLCNLICNYQDIM